MTLGSLCAVMSEGVDAQRRVTSNGGTPMYRHRFVPGSLKEKKEETQRFRGLAPVS
jgi:hypothetical protein